VTLLDSYSEANKDDGQALTDHHPADTNVASAYGQSFTTPAAQYKITSAKFYLNKGGSPTGNAHVTLYAHSGTYGTNSVPTGTALATSDDFDVTTIPGGGAWTVMEIAFTGAQQYTMDASTYYCIVFENPASGTIDSSNYPRAGLDASSPSHSGSAFRYKNGAWEARGSQDCCFYVYGDAVSAKTASSRMMMGVGW